MPADLLSANETQLGWTAFYATGLIVLQLPVGFQVMWLLYAVFAGGFLLRSP